MRNVWEKQGGEGGGIEEMYSASCERYGSASRLAIKIINSTGKKLWVIKLLDSGGFG